MTHGLETSKKLRIPRIPDNGHRGVLTVEEVSGEILGQIYSFVTAAEPKEIENAIQGVDEKMREIEKRHPSFPSTKIAVLAAVDTALELIDLRSDLDERPPADYDAIMGKRVKELSSILDEQLNSPL